jgi:transcriptional regulator GlxA family with amidase domain
VARAHVQTGLPHRLDAVVERPQPGLLLELTTQDDLVKRALLIVQQTIDTPMTVMKLAESLGVSRRRPERHFMTALGLGPQEAGRKVRLAYARKLLHSTDQTVSRIAAETGFADASHLIRAFRSESGEIPEAWRTLKRAPEVET